MERKSVHGGFTADPCSTLSLWVGPGHPTGRPFQPEPFSGSVFWLFQSISPGLEHPWRHFHRSPSLSVPQGLKTHRAGQAGGLSGGAELFITAPQR